jgi:hypothetical protein
MAGARRTVVVFTLVSIIRAVDASAQKEAMPELTLSLQNVAQIPAAEADEAKEILVRIYRFAGIDLHWKDVDADITVIFRPPPHPRAIPDSGFALGYAPRSKLKAGRIAFVLADRTADTARGLGMEHYVLLAITMAHEVGHLLLPDGSHAVNGIMRGDWTQSDYQKARLGQLLFTEAEGRLMRAELARIAR